VVNTLRDYITKAFINTVDHLGSMTYKVNSLLDDKIGEASAIDLRFSCVQQVCHIIRFSLYYSIKNEKGLHTL